MDENDFYAENLTKPCYRKDSKRLVVEPHLFHVEVSECNHFDAMEECTKRKGQIFSEQRFYDGQFLFYPSDETSLADVSHF